MTIPLVIEKTYQAPVAKVWDAITNNAQMKKWYFDLPDFKPEVGFKFQFYGGTPEQQYLHLCEVTEVIPYQKLTYSWAYDTRPGQSYVTFELFDEGEQTRLTLTHTGIETFSTTDPNFRRESFSAGWEYITGISLKNFVENN